MRHLVVLHVRERGVAGDEEARDGRARDDEGAGAQDAEEHDDAGAEGGHFLFGGGAKGGGVGKVGRVRVIWRSDL